MAKVIDRDKAVVKRITCGECAARVEYTPNEVVTLWSGTDYGGGPDGATGFKCPGCGENIIITRW